MATKVTTASVRIALSHQYSTFEVVMNMENPDGITTKEIENTREIAQALAVDSVNEYKRLSNTNPKIELARVENKLADIKSLIKELDKGEPGKVNPVEIARVEAMPMYSEVKAKKDKTNKK